MRTCTGYEPREALPDLKEQNLKRKAGLVYIMRLTIADMQDSINNIESEIQIREFVKARQGDEMDDDHALPLDEEFDAEEARQTDFDPHLARLNALVTAYAGFSAAAKDLEEAVKESEGQIA